MIPSIEIKQWDDNKTYYDFIKNKMILGHINLVANKIIIYRNKIHIHYYDITYI